MNKQYIDKLAFIEIRDHKVLMARSKGNDRWYHVGGKREGKETDEQALIREVQEELNVQLEPSSITYYGTFEAQADRQPPGINVRLICYMAQHQEQPRAGREIEEISWLSYDQKQQLTPVSQLVFEDLKTNGLIT